MLLHVQFRNLYWVYLQKRKNSQDTRCRITTEFTMKCDCMYNMSNTIECTLKKEIFRCRYIIQNFYWIYYEVLLYVQCVKYYWVYLKNRKIGKGTICKITTESTMKCDCMNNTEITFECTFEKEKSNQGTICKITTECIMKCRCMYNMWNTIWVYRQKKK